MERLLTAIRPSKNEQINISQKLVRIFLEGPSAQRVMSVIHALIRHMPHEVGRAGPRDYPRLPDSLRPILPLLDKWGISDDEQRDRKLRRSARSTRRRLVDQVVPLLPAIDAYLDSFGKDPPEDVCLLGDVAQAALEAQLLLESAN